MIRIKGFLDFTRINESKTEDTNPIESGYPELWKQLTDLGYYEISTPIMKKNGTVLIKNDDRRYTGTVYGLFTKTGYVREKISDSGNKQYSVLKKGLDVQGMVRYVVDKEKKYYSRGEGQAENEEIRRFINSITRSNWKKNKRTGKYDLGGKIWINLREDINKLEELGIDLGVLKEVYVTELPDKKEDFDIFLKKFENAKSITIYLKTRIPLYSLEELEKIENDYGMYLFLPELDRMVNINSISEFDEESWKEIK
jgi:hypothetical protein